MSILYFFSCITAMVEKTNTKATRRRNDSGSSEEDGEESINNNCGISFWIVFNWPEYGISSFAEHISREFLTSEFDLISCKAIRSRDKLNSLFISCKDRNFCSMFYSNIFAAHSSNFYFSKIFRKLATSCHCPVTIRSPKRS